MKGVLMVNDGKPCVAVEGKVIELSSCKLDKHTDGQWLFHMNLDGNYSCWHEGEDVYGFSMRGKFHAFSAIPE